MPDQFEEERRRLVRDYSDASADLKSKFFFHWAILSGATLTLLIPLITQIKTLNINLVNTCALQSAIIALIVSLIASSLYNLFSASGFAVVARENANQKSLISSKFLSRLLTYIIMPLAIFGYIIALMLLYYFINKNLF